MKPLHIPENHQRAISSALVVIEKLVLEIEENLRNPISGNLYMINQDLDSEEESAKILSTISDIKSQIQYLKAKYGLMEETTGLRWLIEVRKSRIWEIMGNLRSSKMKRYGVFPHELIADYEEDMKKLLTLTELL